MNGFSKWLNAELEKLFLSDAIAIHLNLYEDGGNRWSAELVGTERFDSDDEDWVCDEVFVTRENPYTWIEESGWQEILDKMTSEMNKYLETGRYAGQLKEYEGIGIGFVDGDVMILYQR